MKRSLTSTNRFQYIWRMKFFPLFVVGLMLFAACAGTISPEELTGTWIYVHIEELNPNAKDPTTDQDLKNAAPYIRFSKDQKLEIVWQGKTLSSGNFKMEGKMIRYTENLPDGSQREFPFLIKELSENKIVFETMSRDGARVTAVKRK